MYTLTNRTKNVSAGHNDYGHERGFGFSNTEHAFITVSLGVIMIAALVGNFLVCFVVYRKKKLRTGTNIFIVNLACADFAVALFCVPFSMLTSINHVWTLGAVMCNFNGFLNIVFTQTSLLTLTAISVEKYYAIVKPLHRLMTAKKISVIIMWTWLQPAVIAVFPLFGLSAYEFKEGTTQCGVRYPTTLIEYIYGALVVSLGFVIPLCILAYMYFKIFHSVKRHTRRLSRVSLSGPNGKNPTRVHRQVAVTVFIMLIFFVVCWTPFYLYVLIVMTTTEAMRQSFHVQFLGRAGYWCAFLNSAINPYIYGFRNPQFRKEFQLVLCWLCPCVPAFARSKSCSFLRGSKGSWGAYGNYEYHWRGKSPSLIPEHVCEKVRFEFGYESYDNNNEPELLRFEFPVVETGHFNHARNEEDCTSEKNVVIEETSL